MIDIHSHILPGIDDGSKDIEESINMIIEARNLGFEKIISTSHYEEDRFETDIDTRIELINKLKEELNKRNIKIDICIGAEVFVTRSLSELIDDNKISTLNNSRYLLIEFPRNNRLVYMDEVVFEVLSKGLIPIIAHPERYVYVQQDPNIVYDLIEKGALFQSNYSSLLGHYGKEARENFKKTIKA